jgi:golgi-specific brefeldin A-resistance guanine nucleotide exchange factor 1
MTSSGSLVHPQVDPSKEGIWTETWKRIDRFLPDLKGEVQPDGVEEQATKKTQEDPVVEKETEE